MLTTAGLFVISDLENGRAYIKSCV